jgi:predicted phosphodiesterase
LKLTVISDTHGQHEKLGRLAGEVLIHCGDMFNMFGQNHEDFDCMDEWFAEQDFDLILCTGGNHDFELQKRSLYVDNPFKNAIYLGGYVTNMAESSSSARPGCLNCMGRPFTRKTLIWLEIGQIFLRTLTF